MNLWKIERGDVTDYEQTDSAIVAATAEGHARLIMHDEAPGSQDPAVWFLPTTRVEVVGEAVAGLGSGIVLHSYTGA